MTGIVKLINRYKETLLVLGIMAVYSFLFLIYSPLHPWANYAAASDSSVFKTVALMMQKGYMPYKDSFDHKGPLIFIINWIGNQISYYRGVWVIEYGFMICTFYLIYKIARLSVKPLSAVITTLISTSLLFRYFEEGNLTEEYAMLFIAISLYIFLDYFINGVISVVRLAVSGSCLGAVLLLRPNMIAVWIVFCIAVFVSAAVKKEWRRLGKFVIWFSIGVAFVLVPVMIWLAANGALEQCWKDYIVFNMLYTSEKGGSAVFTAQWDLFTTFLNTKVYILALAGILYNLRNRISLNATYLIYMILSLMLICMSGRMHEHYGMVLVPLIAYPVSLIFQNVEAVENVEIYKVFGVILCVYTVSTIILPSEIEWIKRIPAQYQVRNGDGLIEFHDLINIITEYTDESEAISVYGNIDCVYVLSQRKHATRYSYQFPVGEIMPEILNEYFIQLAEELPPLIVVTKAHSEDGRMIDFLKQHGYLFLWGGGEEDMLNGDFLVYYRQ